MQGLTCLLHVSLVTIASAGLSITISCQIKCPADRVIQITNVLYGRTHDLPVTACNPYHDHTPITNFDCVNNTKATPYVKNQCDAKNQCLVINSERVLGSFCVGPKSLKLDYDCVTPTPPIAVAILVANASANLSITVCEGPRPGQIKCPADRLIQITNVLYGRTNDLPVTACNPYHDHTPITNFDCVNNTRATPYVKNQCDAKNQCSVTNLWLLFGDFCYGIPKFLKIDYHCAIPIPIIG